MKRLTVIECVVKFGIEDFTKTYLNLSGEVIPLPNLDRLRDTKVSKLEIRLNEESVYITLDTYLKKI